MAVNFISDSARKLAQRTSTWFIESKLITWVLTGYEPDVTNILHNVYYLDHPDMRDLDDFLCYVDDIRIKECVRNSYIKSVNEHHLVYEYDDEFDEYEQARTRIILRMAWLTICPETEGERDV